MIGIRGGCARPTYTRPETKSTRPRPCPKSIYSLASIRPGISYLDLVSSTTFIAYRIGFASTRGSYFEIVRLSIVDHWRRMNFLIDTCNLSRIHTRTSRAKRTLSKKFRIELSFPFNSFSVRIFFRVKSCSR